MIRKFLVVSLLLATSSTTWAAVKFNCDAPSVTKPQASGGVIKAVAAQTCKAQVKAKGEFNGKAVKAVLLGTLMSAKDEKLVSDGAVAGKGYEWVYNTTRADNTPVGFVTLSAIEKITQYPEKVVYSNKTTSIKADGVAANLKESTVETSVELVTLQSGDSYILFKNENTGSVKQGLLTNLLSGKLNELLQGQVNQSTQTTIGQLEKALN